jgi:hypothetical protein
MMIHARHHWPNAITANIWPYVLKMANAIHLSTPSLKQTDAPSPLEVFAGVGVRPKISSFHPFGCPVYILDSALAAVKSLPKWEDRARVGIFLGPSPRHSRLVVLVLPLTTGLVSPQYHVVFDVHFQTVRSTGPGAMHYKSDWQSLAGFEHEPVKTKAKKTKRGGHAARMLAQVLDPIFPGQGRELNGNDADMEGSEDTDVLPPEGADDGSIEQLPTPAIDPEPPDAERVPGPQTRSSGRM